MLFFTTTSSVRCELPFCILHSAILIAPIRGNIFAIFGNIYYLCKALNAHLTQVTVDKWAGRI